MDEIFFVRLRALTGASRVEQVRASAWPALRIALRDHGYFAEAVLRVGEAPRAPVPFPLHLYAEGSEAPERLARIRQIARAFAGAAALCADKPRRAEAAFAALEADVLPLGPDAAAAMWSEAAAAFFRVGDEDHADRMLGRLAALARRAPLDAGLLGRAALPGEEGAPFHPDLLDVAAARAAATWSPDAALLLRLAALWRRLASGRRPPGGSFRALEAAADACADPASARARIDAVLLGMAGLAGTWLPGPEADALRTRITALWARTFAAAERGAAVRAAIAADLLALLPQLPASAVARMLLAGPPGAPLGPSEASLLAAALANDWIHAPERRPLLAAQLADLDAAAPGLSATLAALAPGPLGPAEEAAPPRHGTRAALHDALARWMLPAFVAAARAAFAIGSTAADLSALAPSPAAAWTNAVRLLGLAQDEQTPLPLAEDALALAESLSTRIAASDGVNPDALRAGIALTRANLPDRRLLHPAHWPAPMLAGLPDPDDARLVLLTWTLGQLEAREARTSHLRLTRIAAATPLVRAELGKLVPAPARALGRSGAPSALTRLVAAALVHVPREGAPPLGDFVLLTPPRRFAEVFASHLGLPLDAQLAPAAPAQSPAMPAPASAGLAFLAHPRQPDEGALAALLAPSRPAPAPLPAPEPVPPPRVAGHLLALGPGGEVVVFSPRGEPLRRIPPAVRRDEAYRALVRGRRDDRARARQALRTLEARLTSAEPLPAEALAWLLADPISAALLRHLVIAPAPPPAAPVQPAGLLWAWDEARGLGAVPLDYDARWLGWIDVELVHPARLPDLAAWRALLGDLGVRQELPQLFRERASLPPAAHEHTESLALAGRAARSAASLLSALAAEGFHTRPGLARRTFTHRDAAGPLEAWFDPGRAPWPSDPCTCGAFGFRDEKGISLPLAAVPAPVLHETQRSIERALARVASRGIR